MWIDRLGYAYCSDHRPDTADQSPCDEDDADHCERCGTLIYTVPTIVIENAVVEYPACRIF